MKEIFLKTWDNVKIAVNYHKAGANSVIIIAPGWCMTKDSNAFLQIAKTFAPYFDVLSFDFRGHGKSSGFYTFSALEERDLGTVIDFARSRRYENIYIMGFSLGAAISTIYTAKNEGISKLILVSAPTDFNKIENQMWKKEAWGETFKKFELERFLSIRPNLIPRKKEKPIDLINKIETPTLFIGGKLDPTVKAWHTEALFKKAKCKKQIKIFENGIHAEDLFLHHKTKFENLCLDWLRA